MFNVVNSKREAKISQIVEITRPVVVDDECEHYRWRSPQDKITSLYDSGIYYDCHLITLLTVI